MTRARDQLGAMFVDEAVEAEVARTWRRNTRDVNEEGASRGSL